MKYCRGLKPVRHSFGLRLRNYLSLSTLPTPPATFGRDMSGVTCQMFGNDSYGDCVECAQINATIVWSWANGVHVPFTETAALDLYELEGGYVPGNPSTDQGTDMEAAAVSWKTTGVKDASGSIHKIDDYLWIDKGDIEILLAANWLFEAVPTGANIGDNQEQQFDDNQPWDGTPSGDVGGHCFLLKGVKNDMFVATTWARWEQPVTDSFLADNGSGTIIPYTAAMLVKNKSIEGFDAEALEADLVTLRQEAA